MGSSGYPLEVGRKEDSEDEGDGGGKWRVTQTDLSERRIRQPGEILCEKPTEVRATD